MKGTRKFLAGLALAGMATVGGTAAAATFDLNNCSGTGLICPWVTYGDGNSYALNLNAYIYDAYSGGGTGTQNPFFVQSSPGQISSLIVNATGSSGVPIETNYPNMDNAYPTPSGVNGSIFFSMNKTAYGQPVGGNPPAYPADPGGVGEFTGDLANSWDTTVAALQSFLGAGNTPIFFFNNNQTNSGATIDQDLAVWAQVSLTDAAGNTIYFDFTNTLHAYAPPSVSPLDPRFFGNPGAYTSTGAGPVAGTNASTDYVLSGGRLCIMPGTPYPALIDNLPDGSCPAGTTSIANNLGANQAAYAVVFPELNAALLSGQYVSMHVDLRFGCDPNTLNQATNCTGRSANNGFEQLFIASAAGVRVPEPGTLALMGLGLVGLGLARRRTRSES